MPGAKDEGVGCDTGRPLCGAPARFSGRLALRRTPPPLLPPHRQSHAHPEGARPVRLVTRKDLEDPVTLSGAASAVLLVIVAVGVAIAAALWAIGLNGHPEPPRHPAPHHSASQ